jgi:heme oxygenase
MRPKPYKDAYRARLDALCPDSGEIDRIVGEVKFAFRLNQAMFDELTGKVQDGCSLPDRGQT